MSGKRNVPAITGTDGTDVPAEETESSGNGFAYRLPKKSRVDRDVAIDH